MKRLKYWESTTIAGEEYVAAPYPYGDRGGNSKFIEAIRGSTVPRSVCDHCPSLTENRDRLKAQGFDVPECPVCPSDGIIIRAEWAPLYRIHLGGSGDENDPD
jgi:hypothetical protein